MLALHSGEDVAGDTCTRLHVAINEATFKDALIIIDRIVQARSAFVVVIFLRGIDKVGETRGWVRP
jgi:hypothetical protein